MRNVGHESTSLGIHESEQPRDSVHIHMEGLWNGMKTYGLAETTSTPFPKQPPVTRVLAVMRATRALQR
jgi:hypothetical protein